MCHCVVIVPFLPNKWIQIFYLSVIQRRGKVFQNKNKEIAQYFFYICFKTCIIGSEPKMLIFLTNLCIFVFTLFLRGADLWIWACCARNSQLNWFICLVCLLVCLWIRLSLCNGVVVYTTPLHLSFFLLLFVWFFFECLSPALSVFLLLGKLSLLWGEIFHCSIQRHWAYLL